MDLKNKTQAASLYWKQTGRICLERKKKTTEKLQYIKCSWLQNVLDFSKIGKQMANGHGSPALAQI